MNKTPFLSNHTTKKTKETVFSLCPQTYHISFVSPNTLLTTQDIPAEEKNQISFFLASALFFFVIFIHSPRSHILCAVCITIDLTSWCLKKRSSWTILSFYLVMIWEDELLRSLTFIISLFWVSEWFLRLLPPWRRFQTH